MSTLSANEKFLSSAIQTAPTTVILGAILRSLLFFDFYNSSKPRGAMSYVSHIYEYGNSTITIFLVAYLLLTIMCVVKLVKFEKGPPSGSALAYLFLPP